MSGGVMKTTHAINFFLIGFTMCFSPAYWPEYFSGDAMRGNASELWMLLMGAAQMGLGAGSAAVNVVPRLIHYLADWEPLTLNFVLADVGWALPESFYSGLNEVEEAGVAA